MSLRLNSTHKQAFVLAVMQDVPNEDFDTELAKLVNEAIDEETPKDLQEIIDKYPKWFAKATQVRVPAPFNSIVVKRPFKLQDNTSYYWSAYVDNLATNTKTWKKILELCEKAKTARSSRTELQNRLTAAINSCKTLRQAREAFPELIKYLPAEPGRTQTENLPAQFEVVNALVNLGWPKQE